MHATMKKLQNKNYVFKPHVCPQEITLPMLVEEMKSPDTNLETYRRDQLWECYYSLMFPPNKFGLTADLTDNTPLFYFKEINDAPSFEKYSTKNLTNPYDKYSTGNLNTSFEKYSTENLTKPLINTVLEN